MADGEKNINIKPREQRTESKKTKKIMKKMKTTISAGQLEEKIGSKKLTVGCVLVDTTHMTIRSRRLEFQA